MINHVTEGKLFPELPIPPHFDPQKVGQVWRVPYQERATEAHQWAVDHRIPSARYDKFNIAFLGIDIQNSFCIPGFELFVSGRSGMAAVEDNVRLCKWLYRNLGRLTQIIVTLDTHRVMQIFHPIFLVDKHGNHPEPFSLISSQDIKDGRWEFNPALTGDDKFDPEFVNRHLVYYTRILEERGRYELTIWPYHAMLGSIGHALVSAIEEAIFFHSISRSSQARFEMKGDNPLTEHYSALGPEVMSDTKGEIIAQSNDYFLDTLEQYDMLIVAGQAKSHCVAATIDDLLTVIYKSDRKIAQKVYLLEDCTSPVVVPGEADYTDAADDAFNRFARAGMHIVSTGLPIECWPFVND